MKSFIEEYGKILVLTIIVMVLFSALVLFIRGDITKDNSPKNKLGQENVSETLVSYGKILDPVLIIESDSLESNKTYDLLSFVTEAHSAPGSVGKNGEKLYSEGGDKLALFDTVKVVKITDPFGNELEIPEKVSGKTLYSFAPYEIDLESKEHSDYTIGYQVTYEITDNYYQDYPVTTTKIYQFVVN